MATTAQLLEEAKAALHKLKTGTSVVEFRDSNGESVRYRPSNSGDLQAYIRQLELQLETENGSTVSGPMRVWMG